MPATCHWDETTNIFTVTVTTHGTEVLLPQTFTATSESEVEAYQQVIDRLAYGVDQLSACVFTVCLRRELL